MTNRLVEGFALAAEYHADQVRKATSIPYISHLMSVAALVMENGGNEDQVIAGLLHDALEDADSADEALRREGVIRDKFSEAVIAMVLGCTDGTPDAGGAKSNWQERKRHYLDHLAHASDATLLVSCADKLHNARAIAADFATFGDAVFERFNAGKDGTTWYYRELLATFQARMPGTPIVRELKAAVERFAP